MMNLTSDTPGVPGKAVDWWLLGPHGSMARLVEPEGQELWFLLIVEVVVGHYDQTAVTARKVRAKRDTF